MERYEVDTLLVTGASVTLPDGRHIELPNCYVYELADVAWERIKKLSVTEQQNPSRHTSGPVAASVAAQEDDK